MFALDFHSVLALGTAIAVLLKAVCLLLAPMLGGSRATRLLVAGNSCFTAMLALRMLVAALPSSVVYGAIWSLLIAASALHWLALRELGPDRGGSLRITASFGIAPFGPEDAGLDLRLRQAGEALCAAKRGERNRVVCWEPGVGVPAGA
jgi:GGDEF domain-containing protein